VNQQLTSTRIRETRAYLAITLEDAAAAASIRQEQLQQIEQGQRTVDDLTIQRLARAFGCVPAYLTSEPVQDEDTIAVLARLTGGLTGPDRLEALRFASYLRHATES
jgi:transcriptional regulator with XRE-family HTH domain